MKHQIAIVETAQPLWQREISAAWRAYQKTEHHGLELGRVLREARDNLKSKGGYGSKGKGLTGYLQVLDIPRGTSDYWMLEHEYTVGLKQRPIPPNDDAKPKHKSKEWTHVEHEAASHELLRNEVRAYCVKMRKDPEYKAKLEAFFREVTEGLGVVVEVRVGS